MPIIGLRILATKLAPFSDQFVLIGGSACTIAFNELGLDFRATKDVDMLMITAGDSLPFLHAVSEFLITGGYSHGLDAGGQHRHFRFTHPKKDDYPPMVELFARQALADDVTRSCFPIARAGEQDGLLSLSAIALNDEYYQWLQGGRKIVQELPIVETAYLLPLKVLAWKNFSQAQADGRKEQTQRIKKHRLDCYRLLSIIAPDRRVALPLNIKADVQEFHDAMRHQQTGLPPECKQRPLNEWLELLTAIYLSTT